MYTPGRSGAKPRVVVRRASGVPRLMTPSHGLHDAPDWDTLARYRAGESTPEEALLLARWLADHPADAALLDALDALVGSHIAPVDSSVDSVEVEHALTQLHDRMKSEAAPAVPRLTLARGVAPQGVVARPRRWALGGLAAAAVIGAIAFSLQRQSASPSISGPTPSAGSTPAQEYRTAVGVVDSVLLADGTRVLIGPASHLLVPSSYGRSTREVTLEGIARFSVQHDAALPFAVHAGSALVRDVGTRFTVRAPVHGAGVRTSVAVSEGEVTLSSSSNGAPPTSLRAGDRGEIATDGSVVARRGAYRSGEDGWTSGALVYDGAPLSLVQDDLKRWYGLDVQVDAALAERKLTATFERQDADQLLRTLGLALGMRVQRTGAVVTLRPAAIGR